MVTNSRDINFVINIVVYTSILCVVFDPLPLGGGIALLILTYIFIIIKSRDFIILYPFYVYPFMFLLRSQDPDNLLLTILPDIFALIAICYKSIMMTLKKNISKYSYLLLLYSLLVAFISIFNSPNFSFFPLIIRQYILPVLFLVVFLETSRRKDALARDALLISFCAFSIVACLSICNYLNFIHIKPSMTALYPYLNYSIEGDAEVVGGRSVYSDIIIPRLNLFTGGALGSSASILLALGLIPYISKKNNKMGLFYKVSALFLISASVLTLSTSIIISFSIFLLFLSISKSFQVHITFILSCILLIIISSFSFFIPVTLLQYLHNEILLGFLYYLKSIDTWALMIGSGPRFVAKGFEFVPETFIIDVGIFRIFVETGLFTFFIFASFLFFIIRKGYIVGIKSDSHGGRAFFFLFIVFILSVHANMTALPPFFPLFSAVIAGIVSAHSRVQRMGYPRFR